MLPSYSAIFFAGCPVIVFNKNLLNILIKLPCHLQLVIALLISLNFYTYHFFFSDNFSLG